MMDPMQFLGVMQQELEHQRQLMALPMDPGHTVAEWVRLHSIFEVCPLHPSYRLFPLESSWCHGLRTPAERNGTVRRAGAKSRRSKVLNVKRNVNWWRNLKSVMKLQRLFLKSQAARTDGTLPGMIHVSHLLALLHGHENVFFLHTTRCCQRWWITEATEVSVRRLWRIPPESET